MKVKLEEEKIVRYLKKYDLDNYEDKGIILEFERFIEGMKNQPLEGQLSDYGEPFDSIKYPLLKDMVHNPIIGGAHWTLVRYCIDNKIIGHRPSFWALRVCQEVKENYTGGRCVTEKYDEFRQKLNAYWELRNKRAYAKSIGDREIPEEEINPQTLFD